MNGLKQVNLFTLDGYTLRLTLTLFFINFLGLQYTISTVAKYHSITLGFTSLNPTISPVFAHAPFVPAQVHHRPLLASPLIHHSPHFIVKYIFLKKKPFFPSFYIAYDE